MDINGNGTTPLVTSPSGNETPQMSIKSPNRPKLSSKSSIAAGQLGGQIHAIWGSISRSSGHKVADRLNNNDVGTPTGELSGGQITGQIIPTMLAEEKAGKKAKKNK